MATLPARAAGTNVTHQEPFAKTPRAVLLDESLSDGAVRCYAVLDTYWRENKEWCWPSQEHLARQMSCSVRTVGNRLRELRDAGVIEVKRQGLTKPNRYRRLTRRHLRVVPPKSSDRQVVADQDRKLVADKEDTYEADTSSTSTGATSRSSLPSQEHERRLQVVRYAEENLLPLLVDADARTGTTIARTILTADRPLHQGHVDYLTDLVLGMLDRRWWGANQEVENDAAFVVHTLRHYGNDYWACLSGRYADGGDPSASRTEPDDDAESEVARLLAGVFGGDRL